MRYAVIATLSFCMTVGASTTAAWPRQVTVPTLAPVAPDGSEYDVLANVFTDAQRKMLDRDTRCHDARAATDAFVASVGTALQTGVDAMAALERCATLSRVGTDWGDFRDYVITAAAALAYRVGTAAGDARLLHRAVDDASHVGGFEASNATVKAYRINDSVAPESNMNGHAMGEGPPQASRQYVSETKQIAAYSGSYGKAATAIAHAANAQLARLTARPAER